MKTIFITTGGFPVLGEYFEHLQDGMIEAVKGSTSHMGDALISGCVITNTGGTNYACTEGFLRWNGEIYHVPAHTLVIAGGNQAVAYLVPTNVLVPIEYQSGSQPNMVVNTEVKFKGAAGAGAGEKLMSGFSLEFYMPGNWVDVAPYNVIVDASVPYFGEYWATGDGTVPGGDLVGHKARCRVNGNWLELDGYCITSVDPPPALICILPVPMRPKYRKRVPVHIYLNDSATVLPLASIQIDPNGEVKLITTYTANGVALSLCGVRVRLR